MKKITAFIFMVVTFVAMCAFSSSASNEISYPKLDKNVYGTGVLHWTMSKLHDDYYFEIYMNEEKINPQIKYNGTTFYCYIDNVYPQIPNKYTVKYYTKDIDRYVLMDSEYTNGTIENSFYPYSSSKFTAESKSSTTMNLSWSYDDYDISYVRNYENGGYFFDDDTLNFKVYYRTIGGSWKLAGETDNESYTVKNLTEGNEYQFKVEAYCETVSDGKAKLVDVTNEINAKVAIEYFENVKVDSITETSAVVKWDFDKDLLLATGVYSDEVSFDIYLEYEEDYDDKVEKIGTTKDYNFNITDLTKGLDYTVYVKANCTRTNGISELVETSNKIDFETLFHHITDLKVDSITASTATISWSMDYGDLDYYDDIYFYVYLVNPDGSATRVGKTESMTFTINKLESYTDYKVKLALYADDWGGMKKIEVTDIVNFKTALGAPERMIIAYETSTKKATVKWSKVTGADGYVLYQYDYDLKKYEKVTLTKNSNYTFKYKAGEKYNFYVKAYETINGKNKTGESIKKTFIPATGVTVSASNAVVKPSKKITLTSKLAPSNTTDTIKWTTSNSKVATVTSKGVVKGIKEGNATITATSSSGKKATIKIYVSSAAISNTSKTVNVGQQYTLKVNNYSGKVTWSTSNKSIATVSSKGVVKGVKAGTVTITAKTANGLTFTCKVKVVKAYLSKTSLSIVIGESRTLALKNAGSTVTWSSSNSKIAKVDSSGNVKGVAKGTATVYATCGGVKYSCTVTVKNQPISIKSVDWYKGYSGGVYPSIKIKNISSKNIDTIEFDVWYLRANGSYSYCDIYNDYYDELYTIDVLHTGETITYEWNEAVHWNANLSAMYFGEVRVYFTDGTSLKYDYNYYWYDSNYYGGF